MLFMAKEIAELGISVDWIYSMGNLVGNGTDYLAV